MRNVHKKISVSFLMVFLISPFVLTAISTQSGYGGTFATSIVEPEHSFLLSKITFESDVPLSEEEFLYLTDLKTGTFVTKKKIDRAYKQLTLKRRFTAIDIDWSDYDTGKHLHF